MKNLRNEYLVLSILPFMMIIFALVNSPINLLFKDLSTIIKHNNILISDYFVIGSISATFFNSAIITFFNIFIFYRLKLKLNGLLIVCLFLMTSFGFMGKNIINIIPFYIGAYINAKIFKKSFKSNVAIAIMSSTLAPIVNILPYHIGYILAVFIGIIMPIITPHTLHFHSGYNLYNSGLAGGFLAIVIYSIIKAMGLSFDLNLSFYDKYNKNLFIFFLTYFIILILIGLLSQNDIIKKIKKLHKHTGRLVTDFVQIEGFYISILNMGILGILCLFIANYYKLLNAPIICSLLTVVGFGGFGKHIKNVLPIISGVIIAKYIFFNIDINLTVFLMIVFFSTTLAPIAGKFGVLAGILIGIIHYTISINIGTIHGGINLYNNGLAAGILASIFVPIAEEIMNFKKE